MAINLDDVAEQAKTANKETLQTFVRLLVSEVDNLRASFEAARIETDRLRGVARREDAYKEVVNASKPFTTDQFHGLVGSSNHSLQTRLIVALKVLESVSK